MSVGKKRNSVTSGTPRNYVIIIPCRDEADYIQETIDSIVAQTVPPKELVIVNDGSSDATGRIADAAAETYPWIQVVHQPNRGTRKVGGGVIEAFYAGYEVLRTNDYYYLCKMDADVTFGTEYFEHILSLMESDPRLGAASGRLFESSENGLEEARMVPEMVSGALRFFRRECWEEIGGFVPEVMWDGIDFHRARMFGWKTGNFPDEKLHIHHHRLMGSSHRSVFHGRLRWGAGQWFMGTHPLYIIASGLYRMRDRPRVIGGLLIIAGYFRAMLTGKRRYDDPVFRKHLHAWQLRRLGLGWLAPRVEEPSQNTSNPPN